jgi:dTDP-4-amino-4,6-dideoxygalactose transaminase
MFYVLLPDQATRDHVLSEMTRAGVRATFHYVPLHSSDGGRRFAGGETPCPVTGDIAGRLLRLPFHNALTSGQMERVVDSFLGALE